MEPDNTDQAKSVPVNNPLEVMQPGETVLCEIKRHPFGIISLFIANGLFIVVLAIFAFIVAPQKLTSEPRSAVLTISMVIFVIAALLSIAFMYIINKIYWGNRWILTSDSITQVKQTSLLDKEAKQLSLSSVEDVTAEQHGFMAKIFNYGTVRADTAKERCEFMFTYCPDPTKYAKQVLDAREKFEQGKG